MEVGACAAWTLFEALPQDASVEFCQTSAVELKTYRYIYIYVNVCVCVCACVCV